MKRSIHLFNGLMAALLLSGCIGYQLGGTHPAGIETVYMAPIINKTTEPAIELQLTHKLRSRIQFDGRVKLSNTEKAAHAVIEVTLTDYTLKAVAFREDQKTTASQYRLRITAISTLKDSQTGEVLSESKTYGETTFLFKSDLTTSKRDALPRATQELAKFILDDLIERW